MAISSVFLHYKAECLFYQLPPYKKEPVQTGPFYFTQSHFRLVQLDQLLEGLICHHVQLRGSYLD